MLALLITTVEVGFGLKLKPWWASVVLVMLSFAGLGVGVLFWLLELGVTYNDSLAGAIPVWIVGFLVIVGLYFGGAGDKKSQD